MYLGLLILIGIPGSGKSTLAKKLKNQYNNFNNISYYFIHVCYDQIIPITLLTRENEWKLMRKKLATEIEKLIHALKSKNINLCPTIFVNDLKNLEFLEDNIVLIIDDNMYLKSMRYTLYQIAKKNQIGYCEVFFNCSLEMALLKNKERQIDSVVSPEIIERMFIQIEVPNKKNAWEKYSLCINSFSDINEFHTDLFTILFDSLSNPEKICFDKSEEKHLSLLQCKTNIIHQADIALRKIVGEEIKKLSNVTSAEKKYYCLKLNEKKADILADLKSGVIFLPTKIVSEIKNIEEKKILLRNYLASYF